mmetsp:Transcript_53183/g.163648  ORF Transcript_53183/g.163648 Transcript_53183/m.163648 type:complete len:207 (-) Transcript_53183:141-761(-)
MEQEIHEYWQQRLASEVASRDELCNHLRGEVERLQGRCHELATINSMGRAAVATDVRNFAVENAALTPNGVAAVPLESLVDFLHVYTNGLVPQLPREQKRGRDRDDDGEQWATDRAGPAPPMAPTGAPVTPTVAQLLAQRHNQTTHNNVSAPASAVSMPQQAQESQQQLVARCAQQHLADRKRRDRGDTLDDEAVQIRPWLFSVAP